MGFGDAFISHSQSKDRPANDQDPQSRAEIATALASLPGAESIAAVLKLADDEDYAVREAAIRSLGVIGDRSHLTYLRQVAFSDDIDVSIEALNSIRVIEDRTFGLRFAA